MDIDSNDVRKRTSGFTLIEILVVAGVLGILSSLGLNSFFSSQRQARDTQRKSDIVQYQTALENYANSHNGKYPRSAVVASSALCSYLGLTNCPKDPKYEYYYSTGDTTSDGAPVAKQYTVWGQLENQIGYNWMGCSNGQVGVSGTGAGSTQATLCTVGSQTPGPAASSPTPYPSFPPLSCQGLPNGSSCLFNSSGMCQACFQNMTPSQTQACVNLACQPGVCQNNTCVSTATPTPTFLPSSCQGLTNGTSCLYGGFTGTGSWAEMCYNCYYKFGPNYWDLCMRTVCSVGSCQNSTCASPTP